MESHPSQVDNSSRFAVRIQCRACRMAVVRVCACFVNNGITVAMLVHIRCQTCYTTSHLRLQLLTRQQGPSALQAALHLNKWVLEILQPKLPCHRLPAPGARRTPRQNF
jgi:hypothetical protein